jgi:hypothetical protein
MVDNFLVISLPTQIPANLKTLDFENRLAFGDAASWRSGLNRPHSPSILPPLASRAQWHDDRGIWHCENLTHAACPNGRTALAPQESREMPS